MLGIAESDDQQGVARDPSLHNEGQGMDYDDVLHFNFVLNYIQLIIHLPIDNSLSFVNNS